MLIYTIIFIASLLVAFVVRSLFKRDLSTNVTLQGSNARIVSSGASKAYQQSKVRKNSRAHALVSSREACRVTDWSQEKTHPVIPMAHHDRNASWLLRERKLVSIGETYKVKRRVVPVQPTLDMVSKPFRKDVAPWARDNRLGIRPWKE